MKAGQQPLLFLNMLLFAVGLGILCEDAASLAQVCLASLTVGIFGLAFFLYKNSSTKTGYVFVLLFFALGAWRFAVANDVPATDISGYHGQETEVSGMLLEEPRRGIDADGSVRFTCVVAAEQVRNAAGLWQPATGSLYLSAQTLEEEMPCLRIGDRLRAVGTVRRLHGYGNPGCVDTVRAARAKGITARLSAGKAGVQVEPQEKRLFFRWSEQVRAMYRRQMQSVMPAADAAAIFAMLFGGYDGIRPELLEAFTATGIIHILSVSGSHITLLAAVLSWLGGLLHWKKGLTAVLVTAAILGYSVLAGGVPPVLRAAFMGILTFLAMVLEREKEAQRILSITGLLLLLYNPWLFFDVSFQLSFLATAGLLYLGPVLQERLIGLPELLRGSLAITLAAQLAALPFLAWYFHQVSLSALLANLLAVPILELMIVAGLAAGLICMVLPMAGRLVFLFDSLFLGLVYEMTRLMSRLPCSQLFLPTFSWGAGLVYYFILAAGAQKAERRVQAVRWCSQHWRTLGMGAAGCLLLAGGWLVSRPPEMAVHFMDVGQGDAALIVTPHGHAFMVDTGGTRDSSFDVGTRVDVPYLWYYGVRQLDYICLTHAHEDHAAGAGGILKKIPVCTVLTGHESRQAYAKSLRLSCTAPELQRLVPAEAGEHFELDGVCIDILYAPAASVEEETNGNEVSNVIRVSYGRASFLFTGDLIKEQEAKLMAERQLQAVTVLKVGHHGSKTSSSQAFLQALHPAYAMICVGADNTFGHPSPEILERLTIAGAKILRTDLDGATVFHTDGQHLRVETFYGRR